MTAEQYRLIVELMEEIAEAKISDNQSRGSDYAGMEMFRIRNDEEFAKRFNEAGEKE